MNINNFLTVNYSDTKQNQQNKVCGTLKNSQMSTSSSGFTSNIKNRTQIVFSAILQSKIKLTTIYWKVGNQTEQTDV